MNLSSKKNAKAGLEYKQANLFARGSVDLFAKDGPVLHSDAVVGYIPVFSRLRSL
jgi:hypothetical protein